MYRIGYSEDIHPFKKGRKLYLGGIYFENEDGLDGHSDADVVLHSIAEAILGALALGDLGDHFPDNDNKYKNISSEFLLNEVVSLMYKEGYAINNIDILIGAHHPKLVDKKQLIRHNVAKILHTDINNVSIKAMSYNNVGPIGKGEAIKSSAIVLLIKQ